MNATAQIRQLESAVTDSPLLGPVLAAWGEIALPDVRLVAGAVAQTVWNQAHDFPPVFGISDIDLVYFDAADLSEEAEVRHSRRINALFDGASTRFDVKNEARVHLWYEAKFGYAIPPYRSAEAAIATFPTTATAVGIRPSKGGMDICAPFGFDDLMRLIVRPNKTQITAAIYRAKVTRWQALWPKLTVVGW
ncbi:nucleotidyltransferase family protein [Pelagibius litoralis]|uniref:Nucleotidyltransferase family protein n=1 Tax=Pelagibius litoralis TaxID=374515 RepID=A0A967F138_9PROT|nr:nucleotidyltransferase family protein [Pelagibius litoralis]NIA71093.1 nucleotidyltransferase family protein [Pelagibius litoralis]